MSNRRLEILVLSTFDGRNANVIRDFLLSFNAYFAHDYFYIFDTRSLTEETDFNRYDAILAFWSVYLLGEYISDEVIERIRESPAAKILFLQDEYREVREMNRAMARLGINLMLTCVDERQHELFYP